MIGVEKFKQTSDLFRVIKTSAKRFARDTQRRPAMDSAPAQVQNFNYFIKKVQTMNRTGMNSRMMTWSAIGIVSHIARVTTGKAYSC